MRLISTLFIFSLFNINSINAKTVQADSSYKNEQFVRCGVRQITPNEISQLSLGEPDLLKGLEGKVPGVDIRNKSKSDSNTKKGTRIILRCGPSPFQTRPLIIVDGVLFENDNTKPEAIYGSGLATLDPNDIESFNILKGEKAAAIYGSLASKGVIIITTKSAKLRKFIIKDFLNGERIAGATVSFISTDKKDTVMLATNDSGVVVTNKLKSTVAYNMFISATGYKLFTTNLIKGYAANRKEILLERNEKICDEVVVSVMSEWRRCRTGSGVSRTIVYPEMKPNNLVDKSNLKIFPNPIPKGSIFNIETFTESEHPITIKITGFDGKLLLSQSQKAIKGLNRFSISTDSRWVSGIYLVHLYANGQLLASSKLILQ